MMEQTATTVNDRIQQDVQQFDPAQAKLARFRDYLTYTVNGIEDTDGQKMVREARLEVKRERVALEKLRKGFVEDAVKYQKAINDAARGYREEMEKIEAHLQSEETKIERMKQEEQERKAAEIKAMFDARRKSLFDLGFGWNGAAYVHTCGACPQLTEAELLTMAQEKFHDFILDQSKAIETWNKEQAEVERKRKEEDDRQRAIAEENARKEAELKAKEEALRQKQERMEQERLEAERAKQRAEQERLEAIEREKQRERDEAQRVEREKRIAAEAAEAERKRIEAEEQAEREAKAEALKRADDKELLQIIRGTIEDARVDANGSAKGLKSAIAQHGIKEVNRHLENAVTVLTNTLNDISR